MLTAKPKFRAATGKQLIKAINKAIKTKELNNGSVDCAFGAYNEDFPHLRFAITLENGSTANFDIETSNDYEDWGKMQKGEGYCRQRAIKYVKIINIEYSMNRELLKLVDGDKIRDADLLNKHLKGIFDGMRVFDYEDKHGSYEDTYYDFIHHKNKK